jgi:hypothetical protein
MHIVVLGKLGHHREIAEYLRERFRISRTGGRFAIVLGKFEGIGEKEGVEARGGAGKAVAGVKASEALFFRAEAELREEGAVFECGGDCTLAESGDGFGNNAHALLVFGREKKRAKERAMDAIAEGEFGGAQALEELISETRRIAERGKQGFAPKLRRPGRR